VPDSSSQLKNNSGLRESQGVGGVDGSHITRRLFKQPVQQGRSERRVEADSLLYVEPLSDARTNQADFFNRLLVSGQREVTPVSVPIRRSSRT